MDEEVIPSDLDPPAYEDPPDYDDVIKVGMDEYFATHVNCHRPTKPTNIWYFMEYVHEQDLYNSFSVFLSVNNC